MAERYSEKDAQEAFRRLCVAFGKTVAGPRLTAGDWWLDTQFAYGGHVICEATTHPGPNGDGLGEGHPLTNTRKSSREFYQYVQTILTGLSLYDPDGQCRRFNAYYQAQHDREQARRAGRKG